MLDADMLMMIYCDTEECYLLVELIHSRFRSNQGVTLGKVQCILFASLSDFTIYRIDI